MSDRAPRARRSQLVALVAILGILTTWNLLRGHVGSSVIIEAAMVVGVLVAMLAFLGGSSLEDLGLKPSALGRGARLGGLAMAVILAVLVVLAALPATRGFFNDDRVKVDLGTMVFKTVVAIPLGTVVLEELAFRGALLSLLCALLPLRWAVGLTSVAFGFWHLAPVLGGAGGPHVAAGLGTVLATTVAGVGFCWLRLRSGSLLAPAMAHVATNSFAFCLAWVLWH